MNHDLETFNTWNKIADLYDKKFTKMDNYNDSYEAFCRKLSKPNSRILDIGTGPGNIVKYMSEIMPNLKIEGIDISPNMIEYAKSNNPKGKFKVMDSRDILKLKGHYEGIVCGFCIPYLNPLETEKLISNCFHLLNESGVFYLSFVEGPYNQTGWKSNGDGDRVFFNYHPLEKIKKDFKDAGFVDWEMHQVSIDTKKEHPEIHTIVLSQKSN